MSAEDLLSQTEPVSDETERIVRLLAAIEDPTVEDTEFAPISRCGLCDSVHNLGPRPAPKHDPAEHEPECAWRLAREWVDQHGR